MCIHAAVGGMPVPPLMLAPARCELRDPLAGALVLGNTTFEVELDPLNSELVQAV